MFFGKNREMAKELSEKLNSKQDDLKLTRFADNKFNGDYSSLTIKIDNGNAYVKRNELAQRGIFTSEKFKNTFMGATTIAMSVCGMAGAAFAVASITTFASTAGIISAAMLGGGAVGATVVVAGEAGRGVYSLFERAVNSVKTLVTGSEYEKVTDYDLVESGIKPEDVATFHQDLLKDYKETGISKEAFDNRVSSSQTLSMAN